MIILKHSQVILECLVLLAEPGEPELLKLIDPDHPEHEGWTVDWHGETVDWHMGDGPIKFVLKRERRLTTTAPDLAVSPGQVMEFCQQCGAPIGTRDE